MLKETITYKDFNGKERTEDCYFHLSMPEIVDFEFSMDGGIIQTINRLTEEEDMKSIVKIFQDLILKSYGIKSPDGKRHMKTKPDGTRYADEFAETPAYSELFMKLATDADAAAKFVNGIIPNDAAEKLLDK